MPSVMIDGTEFRFFDHLFAVSRNGKVLRKLAPYSPSTRPDGYLACGRHRLLHRMVATCWLEKPKNAILVHHRNHDKADNRAANLEWVTPKEHVAERHGDTVGRHVVSDAVRAKLRALRLGTKLSEKTKQKQREASLRLGCIPPPRPLGFKCSKESIAIMRRNNPMNTPCEIDGVSYPSYSEASRAIGVKSHTIRKRCLSKNFPGYRTRT